MRRIALIALLAPALAPGADSYAVRGDLGGMLEAYLTALARQCWTTRAEQVARIHTPAEVTARQNYIRNTIQRELGGFPAKTPLNARVTGTLQRDGYRVEKLMFESQPGYYVTANVYVPTTAAPPFAAVLGTAGHSDAGKAYPLYQRVWIGLVKRGFVVLAYDPPGQGERLEYFDAALGRARLGSGGTREHTMAGTQCLLTGTNMARYEIWDGIRAFDYLLTRADVDPKRIAVVGNSGGGTQSAYLAAMEPRLAAAVPSCYITSWEKLWSGPGPQDAEQDFVPFLKDGLDFPDFLIAFAPKPIEMLTAIRDFFPIDGGRATYAEAKRVFEVLGAGDRVGFFEYDDTHGWSQPRREATYRWLEKWLHGREDSGAEGKFSTEPPENLNCTATGQVSSSLHGQTVQSLNQAMAERMFPRRRATGLRDAASLRRLFAARIGVSGERGRLEVTRHGEIAREGYRIEKVALATEPGIAVPALVFVPAGAGRHRGVILVNDAGKAADAAPGGDLETLVRAGYVAMAPDLRGWGESAPPKGQSGYTSEWQTAMRALLVGKTMAGMQTYDLLRAFDYLASRPDVDPASIAVFGKHNGGAVALYAAALEPRMRAVACEGAAISYMDLVRAPQHQGIMDIVVPGVLRDFDLPDVAGALGGRPLWLVDPPAATAAQEYGARAHIARRSPTLFADWLK